MKQDRDYNVRQYKSVQQNKINAAIKEMFCFILLQHLFYCIC